MSINDTETKKNLKDAVENSWMKNKDAELDLFSQLSTAPNCYTGTMLKWYERRSRVIEGACRVIFTQALEFECGLETSRLEDFEVSTLGTDLYRFHLRDLVRWQFENVTHQEELWQFEVWGAEDRHAKFEETMQELYAALVKQFVHDLVKRFRTNAKVLKRVIVMYYKLVFEF